MPLSFYVTQTYDLPRAPVEERPEPGVEVPRVERPAVFELKTAKRPARAALQRWIDLSA